MTTPDLTTIEICGGAGGQALGIERAGFRHLAVVEVDADACNTLRENGTSPKRPHPWPVVEMDVCEFSATDYHGEVDLFAGGVPCPPFSEAGRQLGGDDERDLFPEALRLIAECNPRAVMLENVKGLSQRRFDDYRAGVLARLDEMGYTAWWKLIFARDFRVPQLRPRFILAAVKHEYADRFAWPEPADEVVTVGAALGDLMAAGGWPGAAAWAKHANTIAPTLVGGSKKHGGADLGPSRARKAWNSLGVKATSVALAPPGPDFPVGDPANMPRLTVQMGGVIQGFPADWQWTGSKVAQWRQVGNAFPPPVAEAVAGALARAITA